MSADTPLPPEDSNSLDATLGPADGPAPGDSALAHPTLSLGAGGAAAPAPGERPLPAAIGRYRILRLLGEGGMGAVYEAEQDKPRRTVALKVIRAAWADPDLLRRFEQESQALARLQHPGIAQIYESGTADGGFGVQPYFAMEIIHGRPLGQFAAEQKLDTRRRLELMIRVCQAVEHAHQRGIIHRDLKPGNILVDESGQPKILDFGLARVTDSDAEATRQTDMGQVLGTLAYMSPEQTTGDPLGVDTRSDIYSLGVILYELLAGRAPYTVGRQIHEALRTIQEVDPTPLSGVNRAYRGDIETIVGKALDKHKERRYASAAELAADIRRYLDDEPIVARPPSTAYQVSKFARRHLALVGGVLAVFLALTLGVVVSTWQAVRARQESARATAMNDFMREMLTAANPDEEGSRDVTVAELLTKASEKADHTLKGQPATEADARTLLGSTFGSLGKVDEAVKELQRAVALREQGAGANTRAHAETMSALGQALAARGDYATAIEAHEKALRILAGLGPEHVSMQVGELERIATARFALSQFDEVARALDRATALAERTSTGQARVRSELLLIRARLAKDWKGDVAQAESLNAVAVDFTRQSGDSTSIADALNSLAISKMDNQKLDEAISLYEEALAIRRRVYGNVHQITAQAIENLANAWYGKQEYARSLTLLDEVRRIREALFGPASFLANRTRYNMAAVARDNKEFARAVVLIDTALVAFRKQLGDESLDVASAYSMRGACRKGLADYAGALADFRAALAICETRGVPTTPVRISTLYRMADMYGAQHDCRALRATADLALKALDPAKPANATWIKRFNDLLAGCR